MLSSEAEPSWFDDGFYTVNEAATLMSIHRERLRNWCRQGLVRHHKDPADRFLYVCRADVDRILAEMKARRAACSKELVRWLAYRDLIGKSAPETIRLPHDAVPRAVAMGMIQEAMRISLEDHGIFKKTAQILVQNATETLDRLYDEHFAKGGNRK
ncbi:helix-turn-helix domain-containing protein [Actinocorallia sp. API 0066]|uniref:helix-turn-helix domain-containing protein n=1 Tax=Actinocorallia sp. API 0066 TaxID=2896846 RepID=UPI001E3DBB39|nr:helix-turn-helix domain-containing protein [Actinocorallia sp. API 0066]MCD0449582.1 helix-turn-helix domain-containing protein [Actinocorallia sp. API 0066]